MTRTSLRARTVFLHEAGHAVVGWALGFEVRGIEFADAETRQRLASAFGGLTLALATVEGPEEFHYRTGRELRSCFVRRLTILMSGKAAESLAYEGEERASRDASFLFGEPFEDDCGGDDGDYAVAHQILNILLPSTKTGRLRSAREIERVAEGYLSRARRDALTHVHQQQEAVRRVAARFQRHGSLTGGEILAICTRAQTKVVLMGRERA